MDPIVDGLEDDYSEQFEFVRLDVDSLRGKTAAQQYGIVGQPTLIFFDDSGEEVRRLMGPQDPGLLELEIERLSQP